MILKIEALFMASDPKRTKLMRRFCSKIEFDGPVSAHRPDLGPCWIWKASVSKRDGYGRFQLGSWKLAHRVAYELALGAIPEDRQLDHLCRTRSCVRPSHLEVVTQQENIRRGMRGVLNTHCPHGHPYIGDNLYINPLGKRICKTCRRAAKRAFDERKRVA